MKFKEYYKIAKFGDIIEAVCPVHLNFVLYVSPYSPRITTIWVDEVDGKYIARDNWATAIDNKNLDIKIIKSNKLIKNSMGITNTIKKLTRKEPNKTFVKAGFMDEYENITEDGKEALTYLLWKEKEIEIKELADKINEENNK